MNLRVLHAGVGSVCVAAGAALVLSGGWAAATRSAPAIRLVLLVRRVALIAAGLAVFMGFILLAQGRRPHVPLHYLYAAFALAAVPLASTMAARQPRRGGLYHAGAGVLLLLMCFRLATTG
ncbi:MAG: hypothetical protein ABR573_03720 [Candidatus Dormibacteria bacterium]